MGKSIKLIGLFVMMLSIALSLSSCKKDVSYLPGTWVASYAVIDGDKEDDLKDLWTFSANGACSIECDFDEYFENSNYDVVTFYGSYTTIGNKTLKIESDKFNVYDEEYDIIQYDLDIDQLTENRMRVSGTVKYYQYFGGIVNTKSAKIAISFSKR